MVKNKFKATNKIEKDQIQTQNLNLVQSQTAFFNAQNHAEILSFKKKKN